MFNSALISPIDLYSYQAQLKLLHAGYYGVPQDRSRVFFIAAQSGLLMPKIPPPSHAYPYKQFDKKLATYEYLEHLARPGNCMPFPDVRLRATISALVCISGHLYLLSTFITA